MEKLILALIVIAINVGIFLVASQMVVWGLATMHVHAGIWGIYFILAAFSFVITSAGKSSNN